MVKSDKISKSHRIQRIFVVLFCPKENTSYSAMLNIAESIPHPESIPPIPELHPTQFNSIPESLLSIPRNSGIAGTDSASGITH
jgi:hypothetical protein